MIPPEITKFIHNVGLHIMGKAKAYATGAGLIFMSVYLCYKGAELSAEAKDLALEHETFQEEFDLLEQELIQIRSFIATDVVPTSSPGLFPFKGKALGTRLTLCDNGKLVILFNW